MTFSELTETWPEENWERSVAYSMLDTADLRAILGVVLGSCTVLNHRILDGGKCNTNIRVDLVARPPVVVRVYKRDVQALQKDETIFSIAKGKFPVPEMMGSLDDLSALPDSLAGRLDGKTIGVFAWIDGQKPHEILQRVGASVLPDLSESLGRLLVDIGHLKAFESHGLLDAKLEYTRRFSSNQQSLIEFMEWSMNEGRACERLGPVLTQSVLAFVHANSALLETIENANVLVHGDFKFSNILMEEVGSKWEVSALLDWEFAYSGPTLADAATLLRHADNWPGFEEGFVRGFTEAGGHPPAEWRKICRLLDLMSLCGFLNASEHREKTFASVKGLIQATCH